MSYPFILDKLLTYCSVPRRDIKWSAICLMMILISSCSLFENPLSKVMILSNECGWYRELPALTKEEKDSLRREVKEVLVENKIANKEECLDRRPN